MGDLLLRDDGFGREKNGENKNYGEKAYIKQPTVCIRRLTVALSFLHLTGNIRGKIWSAQSIFQIIKMNPSNLLKQILAIF